MRNLLLLALCLLLVFGRAEAQQSSGAVTRVNLGSQTLYDGQPSGLFTDNHGALYIDCFVGCSGGGGSTVNQGTGGSSPWLVTSTPYSYTPVTGTQTALAVTTATSLTVPATATFATITAIGGAVNYSIVGDFTPTATNGLPILVGQTINLSGTAVLSAFQAIDQTGSTGTLLVQYTK